MVRAMQKSQMMPMMGSVIRFGEISPFWQYFKSLAIM